MTSKDIMKEIAHTFKCVNAVSKNGKCVSDFQDKRYGKDQRVFTKRAEKATGGKKCCTVCGNLGD